MYSVSLKGRSFADKVVPKLSRLKVLPTSLWYYGIHGELVSKMSQG